MLGGEPVTFWIVAQMFFGLVIVVGAIFAIAYFVSKIVEFLSGD